MTKEQALQLVTNACLKYVGTKQDHVLLEEAIRVLAEALGDKKEETKNEPE